MSNPELNPQETVCEAGIHAGLDIITPREVPLGGLRAMTVRRTLPQRKRSLIGAWCFLDHYGPDDVAVTGGMNVPAHPHIGLQTVSWLFTGEIEHRDSAGFHAFVKPGELNLMTSGRGISHSERSTSNTTILHGTQLWTVLPEHARHGEKTFEHYAPEVLRGDGWIAQVFMGELLGDVSPVKTHTPLVGAEIRLQAGTSLTLEVRPDFEHGVLIDSGSLTIHRSPSPGGAPASDSAPALTPAESGYVAKDELAYLAPGATSLTLTAGSDDVLLLFIGGEPFPEQIVMWWNFIGRTHDEVAQARADWQAEIAAMGVADPSDPAGESSRGLTPEVDRYGLPDSEPEPPLAAPKLPLARLKPRERPGGDARDERSGSN